mmetsp:Transcript_4777/g.5173  ORF Transcript_4777/g.5173 Transcript_4777/m.5173 type:complete len:326 (-) Transcript_4777:40-1017(-)
MLTGSLVTFSRAWRSHRLANQRYERNTTKRRSLALNVTQQQVRYYPKQRRPKSNYQAQKRMQEKSRESISEDEQSPLRFVSQNKLKRSMTFLQSNQVVDPFLPPKTSPLNPFTSLFYRYRYDYTVRLGYSLMHRLQTWWLWLRDVIPYKISNKAAKAKAIELFTQFHELIARQDYQGLNHICSEKLASRVINDMKGTQIQKNAEMSWSAKYIKPKVLFCNVIMTPTEGSDDQYVQLTMRIKSSQSLIVKDKKTGKVIAGDERGIESTTYWVFERNATNEKDEWFIIDNPSAPDEYVHVPTPSAKQKKRQKEMGDDPYKKHRRREE